MTGQELIDWIKDNKAEDYKVRVTDNYGDAVEAYPELGKERFYKRTGAGKREIIETYYIYLS